MDNIIAGKGLFQYLRIDPRLCPGSADYNNLLFAVDLITMDAPEHFRIDDIGLEPSVAPVQFRTGQQQGQ